MADEFRVTMTGDVATLIARLSTMSERIHVRLLPVMHKICIDLHAIVIENLSGRVLHRRTGRLAQAQNMRTTDDGARITSAVGFNRATVPYGAIQEFGGTTRGTVIRAKNAKALRFAVGGEFRFAKSVQHPGSKIPERSFLRSALREIAPEAIAEIKAAVLEEVAL